MSVIFNLLLSGLVSYLEKNPAQVEALAAQAIQWAISELAKVVAK